MIGPVPTFIKNTLLSQRKRHLIKTFGKAICDPYKLFQNFLESHSGETRIFTNAALFLPLAAGIRVKVSSNCWFEGGGGAYVCGVCGVIS